MFQASCRGFYEFSKSRCMMCLFSKLVAGLGSSKSIRSPDLPLTCALVAIAGVVEILQVQTVG